MDFMHARPGHLFRRASLYHTMRVDQILAEHDLAIPDYATMALVQHRPGTAPSDVADTLVMGRGNFVAVLDRLARRKLVVRRARNDDRRYLALYLTPTGQALMAKLDPQIEAFEASLTAEINASGVDVVGALRQWLIRIDVI